MRRVEQIMGMPISIDIPECSDDSVFGEVFGRLRAIDSRFSTYKPESEVCLYASGKLPPDNISSDLAKVIDECRIAEVKTNGYFSAWAGGSFDPSGYVKGWAIAEAGRAIENNGFSRYCIGAGGDILAQSAGGQPWVVGLQDPRDKTKILNKLSIIDGAVCTSGNYERGEHIINPITKKPADGFLSVSIAGPDIIWADILATAVFAMGPQKAVRFLETQAGYQAILITK